VIVRVCPALGAVSVAGDGGAASVEKQESGRTLLPLVVPSERVPAR
jgi:hypothetical protein